MTDRVDLEKRFEAMAVRLERVEKVNRLLKIWGTIAIAAMIAVGPFASNVMAKAKPKVVIASAFELESNGKTVATLGVSNGIPGLVFFDNSSKPVLGVGLTSNGAGITVVDGNSILPGSGIARNIWGVTASGPGAGIGGTTFDSNGKERTRWGDAVNGSGSSLLFFDSNGAVRNGLEYDPTTFFFNGFFSTDGSGHTLSLLGNTLAASGILAANDSFMELLDTAGTERLIEFQNATNEGGADFNAGSTTVQGGWGNP